MQTKKIFLFASLALMGYAANSQTVINIRENSRITSKELREVSSIKFSERNLMLHLTSGDVTSHALADIQKIDFTKISSSSDFVLNDDKSTALIYPNPSNGNESLILFFKSDLTSPIALTIYGLDGTIKTQMEFAPDTDAIFPFQLHNVPSGMYIAVIRQGVLLKTAKIIIK